MSAKSTEELVLVTLTVPELQGVTETGGGACCALPTDFLIEDALRDLKQVHRVFLPDDAGTVQVWLTPGTPPIVQPIIERIEGLGLSVQVVSIPGA